MADAEKTADIQQPRTFQSETLNSKTLNSAGEVVARARAAKIVAKRASPLVLSTPVLKIATFHSSSLGSLVASFPALIALRDSFPGARIDAFARAPVLPLLRCFGGVDEAFARPGGGISSQAALMTRLHGQNYDLALSFSQGSNALLLLWATGAKARVGFVPSRMDALLTHKIPKHHLPGPENWLGLHSSDALELVRGVGAMPRGEKARDFLRISPNITARAQNLVEKAGIDNDFLIIAPQARRHDIARAKNPNNQAFVDVLNQLSPRFSLILAGLKSNSAFLASLDQSANSLVDLGGQTDVLTLAALCEMARGAYGVGQGVLQLAKLFDKPILLASENQTPDHVLRFFGF